LRDAALRAQNGQSILIFPEGTRSVDGRIHPLKKGPFHLAELAGVPIVPVGIQGTRDVLAKDSAIVRAAPVTVRFGAPMRFDGQGGGGGDDFRARVRQALVALSGLPAADELTTDADQAGSAA